MESLTKVADQALAAEEDYLLGTVETLIDQHLDRLGARLDERQDALDDFLQNLADLEENEGLSVQDLLEGVASILNTPVDFTHRQQQELRANPETYIRVIYDEYEKSQVEQEVSRLIGAVEHRLEDSLNLDLASLSLEDWDVLEEQILSGAEKLLKSKRERLLGSAEQDNQEGEIVLDLKQALYEQEMAHSRPDASMKARPRQLVTLLLLMSQGQQNRLERRTISGRPGKKQRLTYSHYASHILQSLELHQLSIEIVKHLEDALLELILAWGRAGTEDAAGASDESLAAAGRRALTEIYRQHILAVTGDLWVEYLTKMEALRVSVILEGYGQRDPLVMYKSQAFKLFQGLVKDMRQAVVSRIFTFLPRSLGMPVIREGDPRPAEGAEV